MLKTIASVIASLTLTSALAASADDDLNNTYKILLTKRPEHSELIKQSQRAWLKFIEAECKTESQILGARMTFQLEYEECLELFKEQRTKYLKETYLN